MSRDFAINKAGAKAAGSDQEPSARADAAAGRIRRLFGFGWWMIPLFLGGMAVLWVAGTGEVVFEPLFLLPILNLVFRTAPCVFIAYLAGRSFSRSGSLPVLGLGMGALFLGFASLVSGLAVMFDVINPGLTVYTVGVWMAGVCHLAGTALGFSFGGRMVKSARLVVSAGYAGVLTVLLALTYLAMEGLTPVFLQPGGGVTPLRFWALLSAATMFGVASALVLAGAWSRSPVFARGYALSLALVAVGLLGILVPGSIGNPVGWLGRIAQYAGCLVLLGAVMIACRRSGDWEALLHEALESSRQRFRTLAEATFEGIVSTDNGIVVDANDQIARLLGCGREDLLGKPVSAIIPDGEAIDPAMSGVVESALHGSDGSPIPVEVRGRTLHRHGRTLQFFAIRDITERKRQELALLKTRDELENRVAERTAELQDRADQLARLTSELTLTEQREKGRLAQMLHDHLQQLLVGAKFGLTVLGRKSPVADGREVSRIEETLDEAIEASRSLTVELSPPILHEGGLAEALCWLIRWARTKLGLEVEMDLDETVVEEREDVRILMFQAVRELLVNVSKYARVGRAGIELVRREGGGYAVTVSDRGAGFDPARIRGRRELVGGFGLFSIRERLHLLGGCFQVESAPGDGTRITLIGPSGGRKVAGLVEEAGAPQERQAIEMPSDLLVNPAGKMAAGDGRIRLLLADDHAVMRQGLSVLLGAEPDLVIVGEASDGEEAVEAARRLRPDVILMDCSMPKLDGVEATRVIAAEDPEIVIIGLSMYEKADRAGAMMEAGAAGYLTKSGKSKDLIATIRRLATEAATRRSVALSRLAVEDESN